MSSLPLAAGLRHLRGRMAVQCRNDESDEQLLHAFISSRDEDAFAVLVRRHGPMVLNLCRRVLGQQHDAEDAFQATFLLLARNAAGLRNKAALASFLHGTAYRMAMLGKRSAARRRKHENQTQTRPSVDPVDEISWREVRTLLDEEIARLPEKYRTAFVLCYLEDLSQAEAARRLGLKERTLSSRVAAARKQLSQRLARRGVELTAVLAATALAAPSILADGLIAVTIKAALATAAGDGLAGVVSASVVELVKGMTAAMVVRKIKIATVVFLALTLLGGASAWAYRGLTVQDAALPKQPAAEAEDKPKAASHKRETAKTVEIRGRVFGPDVKPKAGAKLRMLEDEEEAIELGIAAAEGRFKIVELGVTATDGRFVVSVPKQEKNRWLLAQADDTGFDFCWLGDRKADKAVDLHLVKDQPIRGRVVNTEGKPVAGVRVAVYDVNIYPNNSLDQFLTHWKNRQVNDNSLHGEQLPSILTAALFATTTDTEGRFVLRGLGVERFVSLHFTAGGIAETRAWVVTRPGFDAKSFNKAVLGNRSKSLMEGSGKGRYLEGTEATIVAEPEKILRGVVKEADTGKGRPGVLVQLTRREELRPREGGHILDRAVKARTDAQGRFEIRGARKAKRYMLEVAADPAAVYMQCQVWADDTPGYPPITADITVKKGVLVTGKLIDGSRGKPIRGSVRIAVLINNPFVKDFPTFNSSAGYESQPTRADGTFRLVTIPGPVLLMGGADDPVPFKIPIIDPKYPEYFTKEPGPLDYYNPDGSMSPVDGNFCKVLQIKPDAKIVQQDIVLERASQPVRVQDADGKPLRNFWVGGSHPGNGYAAILCDETDCPVHEIEPGKPRMLVFFQGARRLAGTLTLKGDEKAPVVAKLVPAASVKGRLLDEEGKPLTRVVVHVNYHHQAAWEVYFVLHRHPGANRVFTDADGAFAFDDMIPQQKFELWFYHGKKRFERETKPAEAAIQVKSGECRDLGTIKVKPLAEE